MNAVIPPYAYNGALPANGSFTFADSTGRMAKRRRTDASEYAATEETGWVQSLQQRSHYASQSASSFGSHTDGTLNYATSTANAGGALQETTAGAALNKSSDQWQSTGASPYPDVASYSQQPYFYQQTDPSTYNSPWPPSQTESFAVQNQANSYQAVPVQPGSMPYFPPSHTQPEADATEHTSFDAANVPVNYENGPLQSELPLPQYVTVQDHVSDQPSSEMPPGQASALYLEDANMHMKIQSLPILDNLASQLIHTIAKANFPQIQEIMKGNETEDSQAFMTLKNLFDQTRKVYSRETPFIDAIAIQMFQPKQQEIIRKANIATFISSILGAHDVSFFHLNEFFMETFVPLGHRLLKWQGAVYLELKTQTYISALINSDGNPEAMLDELFPPDLDAQILTRHPDAPSLSPSEQDFIDRSRARKSYLLAEGSADEALRELPKKYAWHDFVREFATSISKNVDGIMNVPARSGPMFGNHAADRRSTNTSRAHQDSTSRSRASLAGGNAVGTIPGVQGLSLIGQNASGSGQHDGDSSKKASAAASTVRQPWSKSEEDALLSGLDRVNGPHWSQILALYGRGGSISEVLKDRNQVQLKDKARNLKLWYLKMGKDVPPALRGVTGELRKRGGARARAALGITDEDDQGDIDADGDVEVDSVDPRLEQSHGSRIVKSSSKKKTKKGS